MLYITALTTAVMAALCVMLSLKVVSIRRREQISVGDGGNDELLRAIRAQGNLLEYAPLTLILFACAEINGVSRIILAILALAFVTGRVLHPAGIQDAKGPFSARVLGMQLTLVSMLALCAVNVLWVGWLVVT